MKALLNCNNGMNRCLHLALRLVSLLKAHCDSFPDCHCLFTAMAMPKAMASRML